MYGYFTSSLVRGDWCVSNPQLKCKIVNQSFPNTNNVVYLDGTKEESWTYYFLSLIYDRNGTYPRYHWYKLYLVYRSHIFISIYWFYFSMYMHVFVSFNFIEILVRRKQSDFVNSRWFLLCGWVCALVDLSMHNSEYMNLFTNWISGRETLACLRMLHCSYNSFYFENPCERFFVLSPTPRKKKWKIWLYFNICRTNELYNCALCQFSVVK